MYIFIYICILPTQLPIYQGNCNFYGQIILCQFIRQKMEVSD